MDALSSPLSKRVVSYQVQPLNALATHATTVLLVFEYLLTLPAKVQHIWSSRKSAVFVLFILLRYTTLLGQTIISLTNLVLGMESTNQRCTSAYVAVQVLFLLSDTSISALLSLRSYAIWNRNTVVLTTLCGFFLALETLDAMRLFYFQQVAIMPLHEYHTLCQILPKASLSRYNIVYLLLSVAFDTCLLLLNVFRTLRLVCECQRLRIKQGLGYIFLRDGVLYFILVEALAIAVVASSMIADKWILVDLIMQLQPALVSILTQRLILNLRDVTEKANGITADADGRASSARIEFARGSFLGNVGAPLRTAEDEHSSDNGNDETVAL